MPGRGFSEMNENFGNSIKAGKHHMITITIILFRCMGNIGLIGTCFLYYESWLASSKIC